MNPCLKTTSGDDLWTLQLPQTHGNTIWMITVNKRGSCVYFSVFDTNPRQEKPIEIRTNGIYLQNIQSLCVSTKENCSLELDTHNEDDTFMIIANHVDGYQEKDELVVFAQKADQPRLQFVIQKNWFF